MGHANPEFLKGTLDMLILKTLSRGPNHGYGTALHIRWLSQDAFNVGEGSLYPALQRLLVNGWVRAEWGITRFVLISPPVTHHKKRCPVIRMGIGGQSGGLPGFRSEAAPLLLHGRRTYPSMQERELGLS